jgi:hypothetical protein
MQMNSSSYNVFGDGIVPKDNIGHVSYKNISALDEQDKGSWSAESKKKAAMAIPLQSGTKTETRVAPQLVTLMEKSPFLFLSS